MSSRPPLAALALLALAAAPLAAQGTIVDDDVVFVREATPWDYTPGASLLGTTASLTQNHLHEHGWWYRVAGDTREFNLLAPDSEDYTGDTSVILWNDVGGRSLLAARETAVVTDAGLPGIGDGGWVQVAMRITNLQAALPLSLELFHYGDLDVAGAAGDSSLPLLETAAHLGFVDGVSADQAEHLCLAADEYWVRPYGPQDAATLLSNATLTNFDSSGLPFGPGDVTEGCQWSAVVPPAAARDFHVYLGVGAPLWCGAPATGIFCGNFETDDGATWSALVP